MTQARISVNILGFASYSTTNLGDGAARTQGSCIGGIRYHYQTKRSFPQNSTHNPDGMRYAPGPAGHNWPTDQP